MNHRVAMAGCGILAGGVLAVTSLAAWNSGNYVVAERLTTGYPGMPLIVALGLVTAALVMSRLGSTAKVVSASATGTLAFLVCVGTGGLALLDVLDSTLNDERIVLVERARSADGDFELVSTGRHRLDWNDHMHNYTVTLRSRDGLLTREVTVLTSDFLEDSEPRPKSMGFTGPASFQIDGRPYAFDRDRLVVTP